jgi:peptide/nickel transport system substrate-binding protein
MRVQAVVLALATLLIAAPARAENVVRWATILQPSGLDPHTFANQQTQAVQLQVFEPLVDVDWQMGIEPSLALRWSLVSPTVWRFELRPGVTFHGVSR